MSDAHIRQLEEHVTQGGPVIWGVGYEDIVGSFEWEPATGKMRIEIQDPLLVDMIKKDLKPDIRAVSLYNEPAIEAVTPTNVFEEGDANPYPG